MDLIAPSDSGSGNGPAGSRFDRRWIAAAAFVLVLALLAGLQLYFRSGREAQAVPAFARAPLVMPGQEAAFAPAAESGLYLPAQTGAPGTDEAPMSLDDFIAGLEKEAPPVHRALVEATKTEPKIRESWETFRKEKGGRAPAGEFMRMLRPVPEFRQLLARFRGDPGFQSAFMKVMQHADLGPAMQGLVQARSAGADPRRAGAEGVRRYGAVGVFKPVGPHAGARADPAAGARWAGNVPAGADRSGPAGQSATAFDSEGAKGPPGDKNETTALDRSWKAKENQIKIETPEDQRKFEEILRMYPCLGTLGKPTVLRLIHNADISQYGVWGSCFRARMYGTCLQSGCTPPLPSKDGPSACWQACLDANGLAATDLQCIQQVRTQPGCGPQDVLASARDQFCVQRCGPPDPKTGKIALLNPPVPYAECGGSPVASMCATTSNAPQTGPVDCTLAANCGNPACADSVSCLCPGGSCPGFSVKGCESFGGLGTHWYDDGTCYSDGGICCGPRTGAGGTGLACDTPGAKVPNARGSCSCAPGTIKWAKGGAAPPAGSVLCP